MHKEAAMVNIAEKMDTEIRLMTNIADWMHSHGKVVSDRERSNAYVGVRIREIEWRGGKYEVVDIDGRTCRIEKK